MKITLDPGHGEKGNAYPPRPGYYEGTQMWKLSQYLTTELQKRGFEVVNTRPKITDDPSLDTRGSAAAKNGSCLFLSLHSNAPASASDTGPTGSVLFYSVKGPQYKDLAEKLVAKVSEVMGHKSRGVQVKKSESNPANDYYGVIRAAANGGCTCAMLVEHGFHTNLKDSAFLIDDANLKKLAEAEAAVIASYFGVSSTGSDGNTSGSTGAAQYRVRKTATDAASQLGAYTVLENAKKAADERKADGYKVFDMSGNLVYNPVATSTPAPPETATGSSDEEVIWNTLKGKGLNDYAIAGLMGNLFAESGLKPTNLQNSYEAKLEHTDATYTAAVDSGEYTNFVRDSAGYGLAQWTYWSRKEALLNYAKEVKASIGNLAMQLSFLWKELQGYTAVMNTLKCATSVRQASDIVLTQYERPADQGEATQVKRAGYGQTYYDKYAGQASPAPSTIETTVDNAIADGVLTDRIHWLGVLSGTIKPNPEYIKIAFDRYHDKVKK